MSSGFVNPQILTCTGCDTAQEARVLAREVVKLKDKQNEGKDEVLAILDSAPRKAS
ncbi:MAG: hypothetical protein AAFY03_06705 [Pseudomonadota bacterium]